MNLTANMSSPADILAQAQAAKLGQKIKTTKGSDDEKLREAANEFEAILVNQMFETMQDNSMHSDLLPENEGEKVFRSMLNSEYANMASQSEKLGLGHLIYQQLKPKVKAPISSKLPELPKKDSSL